MGPYDLTMKRLTSEFAEDYARFALGVDPSVVEPLKVEEVDRTLPSLLREVDFAARVEVNGQEILLLLESQTRWEGDMPERLFQYVARLRERYRLPVYPVVLVFRKRREIRTEWGMEALTLQVVRFRYQVIGLWDVSSAEVIGKGLVGLYPLLPLMRWEGKEDAEVLEESEQLVLERTGEGERRADAYVALRVLSGLRYPSELIDRILRRREIMRESPVYREILEEGKALGLKEGEARGLEKGLELGRKEGLELGEEARLREDVLEVVEIRFGVVPSSLEDLVRKVRGKRALEGLLRRAILVEDVETFREDVRRVLET